MISMNFDIVDVLEPKKPMKPYVKLCSFQTKKLGEIDIFHSFWTYGNWYSSHNLVSLPSGSMTCNINKTICKKGFLCIDDVQELACLGFNGLVMASNNTREQSFCLDYIETFPQRSGVGKCLLKSVGILAQKNKKSDLILYSEPDAISWYRNLAFTEDVTGQCGFTKDIKSLLEI